MNIYIYIYIYIYIHIYIHIPERANQKKEKPYLESRRQRQGAAVVMTTHIRKHAV